MSEQPTNKPVGSTNITVEQIIEHMTPDLQNADGQYIQLGFTPPPTPNDAQLWSEYAGAQHTNHFTQFNTSTRATQLDPNQQQQHYSYGNYVTAQSANTGAAAMYLPDLSQASTPAAYDHNKFMIYAGQPQYVMTNNQDMPIYMPLYPETNECPIYGNQQQNAHVPEPMYMPNNDDIIFSHHRNKLYNRTQLIESLASNWTSNTNGTYSPFGNSSVPQNTPQPQSPPQPQQTFFDLEPQMEHLQTKTHTVSPVVKKQKQIAEVKPMRPSYSDVLTKSVPPQQQQQQQNVPVKQERFEVIKEPKIKNNQIGKKLSKTDKSEKMTKTPLIRQSTNTNLINSTINEKKFNEKLNESERKAKLGRKWVSLDDVNEAYNDFMKTSDNTKLRKSKKGDNAVKNESSHKTNVTTTKKSFLSENNRLGCQWTENDVNDLNDDTKNEEKNINKTVNKKVKELRSNSARQIRFGERSNDKPFNTTTKRNQRFRKRDTNHALGLAGRHVRHYVQRWTKIILRCVLWFLHLLSDICSMSTHLARDLGTVVCDKMVVYTKSFTQNTMALLRRVKLFTKIGGYVDGLFGTSRWAFWKRNRTNNEEGKRRHHHRNKSDENAWRLHSGLEHNITMPTTGEEAMKRLLACKGKDPYSILGVRPDCTDDDVKRYYKRQAFLVHPDKNPQPGAEEAFKILVHAFDIIGEPERRQSYDRKVAESHQVEQAWSELNDLLSQLHQKMEYAANTIRCTNCTKRHRRINVNRPCYAARLCSQCKIHHSAKEGDIWAEATCLGFLWHYYACMDGAVYDITEWAGCQRKNLKHLRPNSHNVQYRIVLGKQAGAGNNGTSNNMHHSANRKQKNGQTSNGETEADLEHFLNNLYSQTDMPTSANGSNGGAGSGTTAHTDVTSSNATRHRNKKTKRKK